MLNLFCAMIARFCSDASRVSTSARPKVRLVGVGLLPLGTLVARVGTAHLRESMAVQTKYGQIYC